MKSFDLRTLARALVACAALNGCGGAPTAAPSTPAIAKVAAPAPPATPDPEAWRIAEPTSGAHVLPQFPVPERKVLKNGVTLFVVHKAAAVATLSVVVRHGASSEPAGKSGLAGLTARMLTEGTKKHSSLALAEASESLGATLEADANRDESHVSFATLTSDVHRGLELLAEVVLTPAFSSSEFTRVKAEWLDGLRAERQEPARISSLVAVRALLGPASGTSVSGSIPDVEKLTAADLAAFHARCYVPSNLAVIVAGDLKLADIEAQAEQLFGRATGTPFAPSTELLKLESPPKLRVLIVDRKDSVQSSVFAIQPFPARSQPGFEARDILGGLVGGLFTSRLNLDLREKHAYTYGVHGQALATRNWGAFIVATEVKTETTADSLTEIISELWRARDPARGEPIVDPEVDRARTDLMHALGARLEHTSLMADAARNVFAQQLPLDYYAKYPALLGSISTAQVALQAPLLTPDHLLVVIVGDRAQIEPSLKQHGFALETADPKLSE